MKDKNKAAFREMLAKFRSRNPDVIITGYNGFGGEMENTFTPFRQTVDLRWLGVFDTLYSGDPRFSDVPMMNIWRSQDNYSDHMNRQFESNGLPLRRIDNCAFMIGTTGTCYYRATHAWKGDVVAGAGAGRVDECISRESGIAEGGGCAVVCEREVQAIIWHGLQRGERFRSLGPIPGSGGWGMGLRAAGAQGVQCIQ